MYFPSPINIGFNSVMEISHSNKFCRPNDPENDDMHIHDFFEIYINISGNVQFLVGNSIYPINSGDIIISSPHEIHKCIYNKETSHESFCIWFDTKNNIFTENFTNRKKGELNLISLSKEDKAIIIEHCFLLHKKYSSSEFDIDFYRAFFEVLSSIEKNLGQAAIPSTIPKEFEKIFEFIDDNFTQKITITDICSRFSISKSTLSRFFRNTLHTTVLAYITDKRLALAKEMLLSGKDVLNTCYDCGFSDCSYFISVFKKHFGTTPHKYVK